MHDLIARHVAASPAAVAVAHRDRALTYGELGGRSAALAADLRQRGVGPGQVVGVFTTRSLETVVAMLGILESGAAYLPLDTAFPPQRLQWMVENTGATLIVTEPGLAAALPSPSATPVIVDLTRPAPDHPSRVSPSATPDDLAYVIFTSGSTGRPKGVMVEHRNVANFFAAMDEQLGDAGRPGAWLAVTSISFDISVLELFWTLARGFTVVVQDDDGPPRAEPRASRRRERHGRWTSACSTSRPTPAERTASERYRLLLEGAKFADTHGFAAVWTPERHFHAFGGLYPEPGRDERGRRRDHRARPASAPAASCCRCTTRSASPRTGRSSTTSPTAASACRSRRAGTPTTSRSRPRTSSAGAS